MKQLSVFLIFLGLALGSCERHAWHSDEDKEPKSTDTINLFLHDDHSGEHAEDHSGGHGDDHSGDDAGKPAEEESDGEAEPEKEEPASDGE